MPVQGRVHKFLSDVCRKNYEVKLENDSGRDKRDKTEIKQEKRKNNSGRDNQQQ